MNRPSIGVAMFALPGPARASGVLLDQLPMRGRQGGAGVKQANCTARRSRRMCDGLFSGRRGRQALLISSANIAVACTAPSRTNPSSESPAALFQACTAPRCCARPQI